MRLEAEKTVVPNLLWDRTLLQDAIHNPSWKVITGPDKPLNSFLTDFHGTSRAFLGMWGYDSADCQFGDLPTCLIHSVIFNQTFSYCICSFFFLQNVFTSRRHHWVWFTQQPLFKQLVWNRTSRWGRNHFPSLSSYLPSPLFPLLPLERRNPEKTWDSLWFSS